MACESKVDFTQGNVKKQLLAYSVPIIIASLLQAFYGLTDMFIAGKFIGTVGISAINNSGQITNILNNIATGLTTGGGILISQYFGNKDEENRLLTTGTVISAFTVFGVVASILLFILSRPILVTLGAPALEEAIVYLRICSFGLFFTFVYNALASVMRAVGNSKIPSRIIMIGTVLNVILDILFMYPLHMGVAGAAIATVFAQIFTAFAALFIILRTPDIFIFSKKMLTLQADKIKMIIKLGTPIAIQMTIAGISWLTVTFLINTYGVEVSAGSGISTKIKDISGLFIIAMSNSAATMIAQNLGAEQYDRSKKIMHEAMKLSFLFSIFIILVMQVAAPYLIGLFTDSEIALNSGSANLRIEIIGQLFYALFMNYHSLAVGAGHTTFALLSSFTNCIAVRVILAIIMNHFFGLTGIYIACAIAPFSSVPLGMIYTRSNVWRKSLVRSKTLPE